MSLFHIPISVAKRIEKATRDFFVGRSWGEKKGSFGVKSRTVTQPICEGGLGLGNLVKRNRALLGKWPWTFPLEVNFFLASGQ